MTQMPSSPLVGPQRSKRHFWRWLWLAVLLMLLGLAGALYYWTGTDRGTRQILGWLSAQQKMIHYQYQGGNLRRGVILTDIHVHTKPVDIRVKRAVLQVGWRAIVQRELHFRQAMLQDFQIIKNTPPSDKPFEFKPIKLPFVLRFDRGSVHNFSIHLSKTNVIRFETILLSDALWSGDTVRLKDSSLTHSAVQVHHITGSIAFREQYPVEATGVLVVPALRNMQLAPIALEAKGSLDTLHAKATVQWPDTATATAVLHPVRAGVPYAGQVAWSDFRWPFAKALNLYSKQGKAQVSGSVTGLQALINTDLKGKYVPSGRYQATAKTDFKGVDIATLKAQVLDGELLAQGHVHWAGGVTWRITGRTDGVNIKSLTPDAADAYIPNQLNARLASTGKLSNTRSTVGAWVQQDQGELWQVGVAQPSTLGAKGVPLWVDARWRSLQRALAGVGMLSSPQGHAAVRVDQGATTINVKTDLKQNQYLPAGYYQADIGLYEKQIKLPKITYQGVAGTLGGAAQIELATEKKPARWQAAVSTKGLYPQKIVSQVPFAFVRGLVQGQGVIRPTTHSIALSKVDLLGRLGATHPQQARSVELVGTGVVGLEIPKHQGLKSFDARFDGRFDTVGVPKGQLHVHALGTPKLVQIKSFDHQSHVGRLNASGSLNLTQGVGWQIKSQMQHVDPSFFVAGWAGDLTGQISSTGAWQATRRELSIDQMQLSGKLRQQPIDANGRLMIGFATNTTQPSLMPTRFDAHDLRVRWGGNQVTANGTRESLDLRVNAPALGQLHPDLSGTVEGQLMVTGQTQSPNINVNLQLNDLKLGDIGLKQGVAQGQLMSLGTKPSHVLLTLQGLSQGARALEQAKATLDGTRQAHVLRVDVEGKTTQLSAQFAGRLQPNLDWIGQVQQGKLSSRLITIEQDQAANVLWTQTNRQLTLSAHCWMDQQRRRSQLCLTQPLQASTQQGQLEMSLQSLDLSTFADLMPQGMIWTGLLNGTAKAAWQAGQDPSLNLVLYTDSGTIGLTADDPQDPPLTLPYQRLSFLAKTQPEGIKIRFDAKTPSIGTGYVDAIIDPKAPQKTINGALVLDDVQMSVFSPFFPAIRNLSGIASLAGGMSGPLSGPDFYGEFKLDDGRVILANAPVSLNRIRMRSSIRGTQATVNGEFYSGEGRGTLDGSINWQNEPFAQLKLLGDELLIRKAPQLTAYVSPSLDIGILPKRHWVSIDGDIQVPKAVITANTDNQNLVSVSSDVRVVDRRLQNVSQDPAVRAASAWRISADVDLKLGQGVFFRGFGANAPLGGQLHLRQRGAEGLTASGSIGVQRAVQVEAFGQNLSLKRGEARFGGSLTQPVLDIEATKAIDGRTVGVRVGGRLSNPGVVIFNDAGLSEQEALNALLTGRISSNNTYTNTAGFKSEVNNTLAAAGLSVGLQGSRNFTNKLGRTFGLSGLTVDAEGVGDDTQVNVTGYISPDLYLRYGVGVFTPVNKLTLRYQVNRRLYVEASSALERAIDIFYNWRF